MEAGQIDGFSNELIFVGSLTDQVTSLINRVAPITSGAIIGGSPIRFGTGNKINLIIASNLEELVKPTWFGFVIRWNFRKLARDDKDVWPAGPIGGPDGNFDVNNSYFTNAIVSTVANTAGWSDTKEHQMEYEAVNILDMTSPATPPIDPLHGIVWSTVALGDEAEFIFRVRPDAYAFNIKDFLAIYALPGSGG